MSFFSQPDCSPSGRRIRLIVLALAVDIISLAFFSGWLSTTRGRWHKVHLAGVVITSVLISFLLTCLKSAYFRKAREVLVDLAAEGDSDADADFLQSLSGLPTRFSFKDLESATDAFSVKLGHGGFGSVYAGTLSDGTQVAVKRLEREGRGQKEFCAEVATISRVRHVNLVCLRGFCAERAERLLVYEFLGRGSLDRWIFHAHGDCWVPPLSPAFTVLSWDTRCRIALETARGLAYLHEGCEDAILHLDVKPQNILLDDRFHAKVSDFGLSRRMDKAHSRVITTVRGTPGYLAPEWLTGGGIDVKTDVYGYGMVVLELVSGRRAIDQSLGDVEHWFLPALAFRRLEDNHAIEVVDPVLQGRLDENNSEQAVKMIKLALWCIQEDAAKRPSMSNVVHMLEGKMEVTDPPSSCNFVASRRLGNGDYTTVTVIDADTLSVAR